MPQQGTSGSATRSATIAICGNPNCGKTTIFNAITGLNQRVANYPGVTVERVSGQFTVASDHERSFTLVDIPGTYSLSAFSPDEDIAVSAMIGRLEDTAIPDGIICVLDATNLERSFAFLLQILEIGRPMVVAVNMIDLAEKHGLQIDFNKMSVALGGMPVVPVIGNRRVGINDLKVVAAQMSDRPPISPGQIYGPETEQLIELLAGDSRNGHRNRAEYLRIVFDTESPAEERFLEEEPEARDNLYEGRRRIKEAHGSLTMAETEALSKKATVLFRQAVTAVQESGPTNSERLDRVLLHPVLGPLFLILTMGVVFQSIFSWAEPITEFIDSTFNWLASQVKAVMDPGPLQSLLTDGIIGGVGSVLVFLPQIIILFLFIALLEDSGYMARAAFLVDRLFRWCGLSGKSFIPMLSSFACAIPGILATRTIEDRKQRYITIMVAPLMTCSARLPVYTIMIAAFIPRETYFGVINLQGSVLAGLYALGVLVAIIISYLLKKIVFRAERGTFLMELPSYKIPMLRSVTIRVINRAKAFLLRAGTVIMAITIIVWSLSYFPRDVGITQEYAALSSAAGLEFEDATAEAAQFMEEYSPTVSGEVTALLDEMELSMAAITDRQALTSYVSEETAKHSEQSRAIDWLAHIRRQELILKATEDDLRNDEAGAHLRNSYFASMGKTLEPAFRPLGWDWKITMATLAAFPAREVIVATIGTIYNLGSDTKDGSSSLIDKMRQDRWEDGPRQGELVYTPAVALSIMVFFALCCQCGATVVTIRRETHRWWYAWGTFVYMTVLAYLSAWGVYQGVKWMGG